VNLKQVIDELIEERGVERSVLTAIVCEGMQSAYQKKHPAIVFSTRYNDSTGELVVLGQKEVVSTVEDENAQISLKKARFVQKDAQIGDLLVLPFEGKIGRVEILYARQIMAQKIRSVEAEMVYNEFKRRQGEIVHGHVHKMERSGAVLKVDDTYAFLPHANMIPGERIVVGMPIKALLKEVLSEPRGDYQLVLDRASSDFLYKLLELEVPEVFEKLIEIKRIVRIAGYKSKMVVLSRDKNIDPVGTCVGVGGSRIRPILAELGGEKIDVIQWSDSIEELVRGALKPAKVNRVELVEEGIAQVWVDDDQRSYAIGKSGQNIALASRLVGLNIQLAQQEPGVMNETEGSSADESW
jgi:transcription termination/antitermination protein NusA